MPNEIIDSFLQEYTPPNPENVVLRNEYYPQGLTEDQIYSYYMSIKDKLLNWINGRKLMFFIHVDNKNIVKRIHKGKAIYLDENNYENIITSRTLCVFVERVKETNYFVIDIDGAKNIEFKKIKEASEKCKELLYGLGVYYWEGLFTSEHGIHLIGYLKRKINIDTLRETLIEKLSLQTDYLVNKKGRKNGINLDLSPNYNKSVHLCRYSLTKDGLVCDDIYSLLTKAAKPI